MRLFITVLTLIHSFSAMAVDFTGPGSWRMVNTNAVERWQTHQSPGKGNLLLKGVVADKAKREVRLLAEAVGHAGGTTAEFLLVAQGSDRVYEAAAVTVANPEDIVKAVEFLGVKRGSCVDSTQFKFRPYGERFQIYVRRLDVEGADEVLFSSLLNDSDPAAPLLADGLVFTGGAWSEEGGKAVCLTDTQPPCSVVSLYNESSTIFDLAQLSSQGQAYGRLTLADKIPYGALLEVILRPLSPEVMVLPLTVTASVVDGVIQLSTTCAEPKIERSEKIESAVAWMRSQAQAGKDVFVALKFDGGLSVMQARAVASLFSILDGSGLKLYGRREGNLYFRALLPQESWRKREERNPQPFEIHVTRDEAGTLKKKLIFIEEDWSGEGIDPILTVKEYPFSDWSELEPLVIKAGGENNRVAVAFFFVPADMKLSEFMPGVNAISKRLPLVHVFAD